MDFPLHRPELSHIIVHHTSFAQRPIMNHNESYMNSEIVCETFVQMMMVFYAALLLPAIPSAATTPNT